MLWAFLPVGLSNMAPVIANNIPLLKRFTQPIDGGKTFRGKRILGKNKTLRGLLSAVLMGLAVGLLQFFVYILLGWPENGLAPINYDTAYVILLGGVLGLGAIFGDAVESFFKRQLGIAPGHNWFLFDQIDYLLGGIIVSFAFFTLPLYQYIFVIFVGILLHPTINIISWLLKLQDKPL